MNYPQSLKGNLIIMLYQYITDIKPEEYSVYFLQRLFFITFV